MHLASQGYVIVVGMISRPVHGYRSAPTHSRDSWTPATHHGELIASTPWRTGLLFVVHTLFQ